MNLKLLERVADDLKNGLAGYEPERITGADADRMLKAFAEIERLASAGKLLSARRVESSNVWRRTGHRSAAAHLADATGTGLGPAITTLETARQLGELPATDDALRGGRLSEAQVKEIAGAAILQPDAEGALVDAAGKQPMNVLRLRCRRVRAGNTDQHEAYEKIRRSRYLRHWSEPDGAVRFDARLTPDDGARLIASIKAEAARLGAEARRAGRDEPPKALSADALYSLICSPTDPSSAQEPGDGPGPANGAGAASGTGAGGRSRCGPSGPTAMVHVRVDHQALVRGHVEPGEVCEIPGIGPIPVEVARQLAVDSLLSVLVTDGIDVRAVTSAKRSIPARVRTALLERDPCCAVSGCDVADGLEIDHVHEFGKGGPTELANLVRLCRWHHYLKTHQRFRLERHGDGWTLVAPSPPPGTDPPPWRTG